MRYLLEELCEFINGGSWSDKEYVEKGLPVLKVTNIKPKGFDLEDIDHLPFSSAEKYSKNMLKIGDVIIATVGSHPNLVDSAAGRSCIVNSMVAGFYLNQNAVCIRTKNPNKLDQKFLGYLSKDRLFQHYIQMRGKGAANQMRIAISAIKSYGFNFPEIQTQRKIGEILSNYDRLITNNQKRIKLLEESAQRLYNEWFVDLRFPGHENVPVVDGVPEGWHLGTLAELVVFRRGKTITKAEVVEGNVPVIAGGLEPAYFHNSANTKAPVITVSGSGANAGYTRLNYEDIFASDCSFADIETTPYIYFVYCFLKHSRETIDALQKGSAQPHVYAKDINAIEITVPSVDLINEFCERTNALFDSIGILQKQNISACESRDRLLPKLMSGEITV